MWSLKKLVFSSILILIIITFSAVPIFCEVSIIMTKSIGTTIGNSPEFIAYDSGKGEIFVSSGQPYGQNDTVLVINDTTNNLVASIKLTGALVNKGYNYLGLAYDSSKSEVFVTNAQANTISVISDSTNSVVATIDAASIPTYIEYDSGKNETFVSNLVSGSVSVISDITNTVVTTVNVGNSPGGIQYDSRNGQIFVANLGDNSISVINDSTNSVIKTISLPAPPSGIAFDSGKNEIFAINQGYDSLSVINATTYSTVATVSLPANTMTAGIVYDSGASEIFVSNNGPDSVSVISDVTNKVVQTLPVPGSLVLAYDSGKGEILGVNGNDNSLIILSDGSSSMPSPTPSASASPSVPEFAFLVFVPLFIILLFAAVIIRIKSGQESLTNKQFQFSQESLTRILLTPKKHSWKLRDLCLNDKALALVLLIILSISMFGFLGFAAAYPDGLVIINADGTIQGTDAIQQIGNVYALTGDINIGGDYKYAGIQVLRDNIVLDGSGFSLATNESGNIGVDIADRNNVTVENFVISGFKQGVFLGNSTGNSISNNTIIGYTGSNPCVGMGIWVDFSSHNNRIISNYLASNSWGGIVVEAASSYNWIEGNNIVNNEIGIGLSYCPYNTLKNNKMLGNNDSLQLAYNTREQFTQTIDSSNTIEEKPVYYWIGEHDKIVPSDAGYIALGDCSDITVEGLQISHGSISICNTVNSTVKNNNLHNCYTGINIQFCDNIKITENNVANSKDYGISIASSSNIDVFKNDLDSCGEGISTYRSQVSQVITITNNEITKNICGIHLVYGQKNLICKNDFLENGLGINFVSCSNNNITENNFQSNSGPSIRLSGFFNNTFYHNNLIYNSEDGHQALNPWITGTPGAGPNVWDNGVEGNYWNDMQTRYPNATQISGGKVWDTVYIINDENIDHYPLVQSYISSQPTLPSQTPQVTDTYAPNTTANSDYPQVNQQNQTLGNLLIATSVTTAVVCAAIGITYFALIRLRRP